MAPQRVQKRKSATSTTSTPSAPIVMALTKNASPAKTPGASPTKRCKVLTQAQKQALIDNLQLEITERARKLRAQYTLQAQGLRTRLEIRVHRIPAALRKMTIQELLEKHKQQSTARALEDQTSSHAIQKVEKAPNSSLSMKPLPQLPPAKTSGRGAKRKSDELSADKENDTHHTGVENPKKRPRTIAQSDAPTATANNASKRVVHPSQVLSPKSHNSRTLPHSPFKSALPSPIRSNIARPLSPLKPSVTAPIAMSPAKTAEKAPTSKARTTTAPRTTSKQPTSTTGTLRVKRAAAAMPPPPPPRLVQASDEFEEGRESSASDATSIGTTIIKTKKVAAKVTASKKVIAAKTSTTGVTKGKKVVAAPKTEAAGNTVKGGRTLRSRA